MEDGTRDKCNHEFISIGLRYVKQEKAFENLVHLSKLEDGKLDAASIVAFTLETFERLGITTSHILSQCYDGASVMCGCRGGVQAIIQQKLRREVPYLHCFSHRLHLVVVYCISSISGLTQYFDYCKTLYNFFRRPKVQSLYSGTYFHCLMEQRWTGHLKTILSVNNCGEICRLLHSVADDNILPDGDIIVEASDLLCVIKTKSCCCNALLAKSILGVITPADNALQARQCSLPAAPKLVEVVRLQLQNLRSDEALERCLKDAEEMVLGARTTDSLLSSTSSTVDSSEPCSKRACRQSVFLSDSIVAAPTGSRSAHDSVFRRTYFEAIDNVTLELDRRFLSRPLYEEVSALDPTSDYFLCREKLIYLRKLDISTPSAEELTVAQSTVLRELSTMQEKCPSTVLEILYSFRQAFPETYDMAASVATLGCSTALCESSSSALSRINTPTRRSMASNRKRSHSLLAFEHKRTKELNMNILLRECASKQRRLQLF